MMKKQLLVLTATIALVSYSNVSALFGYGKGGGSEKLGPEYSGSTRSFSERTQDKLRGFFGRKETPVSEPFGARPMGAAPSLPPKPDWQRGIPMEYKGKPLPLTPREAQLAKPLPALPSKPVIDRTAPSRPQPFTPGEMSASMRSLIASQQKAARETTLPRQRSAWMDVKQKAMREANKLTPQLKQKRGDELSMVERQLAQLNTMLRQAQENIDRIDEEQRMLKSAKYR
jgi:hypothetical protein